MWRRPGRAPQCPRRRQGRSRGGQWGAAGGGGRGGGGRGRRHCCRCRRSRRRRSSSSSCRRRRAHRGHRGNGNGAAQLQQGVRKESLLKKLYAILYKSGLRRLVVRLRYRWLDARAESTLSGRRRLRALQRGADPSCRRACICVASHIPPLPSARGTRSQRARYSAAPAQDAGAHACARVSRRCPACGVHVTTTRSTAWRRLKLQEQAC